MQDAETDQTFPVTGLSPHGGHEPSENRKQYPKRPADPAGQDRPLFNKARKAMSFRLIQKKPPKTPIEKSSSSPVRKDSPDKKTSNTAVNGSFAIFRETAPPPKNSVPNHRCGCLSLGNTGQLLPGTGVFLILICVCQCCARHHSKPSAAQSSKFFYKNIKRQTEYRIRDRQNKDDECRLFIRISSAYSPFYNIYIHCI
jgi:hypothetical protein